MNWKTTVFGIASAVFGYLAHQPGVLGTIGTVGATVMTALFGVVAADASAATK